MAEKITLLVIGCGRIGKMHVENIHRDFSEVNIVAIIDDHLDPAWAQSFDTSALPKAALANALQDDTIHAVLIAASSSDHVNLITMAANAGKHIFCEKPISFNTDQLDEVDSLIQQKNLKLQVGLNRRFDPEFVRVKSIVDNGIIGDIHIIKITNRDPLRPDLNFIPRSGGLFLDFNVHDFDMLRFISGAEITEVYALGANLIDPEIGKLGDIDTAIISVKLSNGALATIDCSRETHYGYDQRLEVFGSKGNVAAHNTQPTQTQLLTETGLHQDKPHWSFVERYAKAYRLQFAEFFAAVANDQPAPVSISDMKKAVLAAIAAQKSFDTHQPVIL